MDQNEKPTEPAPSTNPYEIYRETAVWRVIEEAIDDLVGNNDIVEKTRRDYIVGYICKKLQGIVRAKSTQQLKEKA
jgi:tRNA threonylcarbamoyladenosine modification (KEOPS) complex Cgi121 subunit